MGAFFAFYLLCNYNLIFYQEQWSIVKIHLHLLNKFTQNRVIHFQQYDELVLPRISLLRYNYPRKLTK